MKLFCVYLVFQWDNIVGKVLPKVGVSTKYKKGDMNSHVEGLSKEGGGGFKPSAHYDPIKSENRSHAKSGTIFTWNGQLV